MDSVKKEIPRSPVAFTKWDADGPQGTPMASSKTVRELRELDG